MPTTERFCVSQDDKLFYSQETDRELIRSGKAKYTIEVFGYSHEVVANEVKTMVENAGMENKLYTIRVETR